MTTLFFFNSLSEHHVERVKIKDFNNHADTTLIKEDQTLIFLFHFQKKNEFFPSHFKM